MIPYAFITLDVSLLFEFRKSYERKIIYLMRKIQFVKLSFYLG